MPLLLSLALGCSTPSGEPSAAMVCASVQPHAKDLHQLAAQAARHPKRQASLAGKSRPPVDRDAYARPTHPIRAEGRRRGEFQVLCEGLVTTTRPFSELLPARHGPALAEASKGLAPQCASLTPESARRAQQALMRLQSALQGFIDACAGLGEPLPDPDPALACAGTQSAVLPLLKAVGTASPELSELEEERELMRRAAARDPFEGEALVEPLSRVGLVEGRFDTRCDNLLGLVDAHLTRHPAAASLATTQSALVELRERCKSVPFDVTAPLSDARAAEVAEVGEQITTGVRTTLTAFRDELAVCAGDTPAR